jgi:tRNA 2-thiouridine synthesizing protein A
MLGPRFRGDEWNIECKSIMSLEKDRDTVLDLRGLRCAQPVLRAVKALRKVPIGGTLVLECTDPLTVIDVPHFVKQTGQALTGHEQRGPLYVFRILKRR